VTRQRGEVVVTGERAVIAHVGAWLLAHLDPIPADLRVDVPDLEAALLTLLDQPEPSQEALR
jgi:ABC-2 type transport system ATP-binding protein